LSQAEHKKNNRLTIIALLAIFTLPVIVAYSAYFNGWFNSSITVNKGELITPVIDLTKAKPINSDGEAFIFDAGEPWRIILPINDSSCLLSEEVDGCILDIYIMGQVHQALGKEQDRVKRVLYTGSLNLSQNQITEIQKRFVDLEVVSGEDISAVGLNPNFIYIADPIGNIMLRYPHVTKKEDAFLKGKEILKDLKKMLKLSRIG